MALAFLKHCKTKSNIKELEGPELVELFSRYYKTDSKILQRTKDGNVNIESILNDNKDDLIEEFELEDKDVIDEFLILRVILRKAIISQREKIEDITERNIKKLSWDGVCQLFEQEVGTNLSIAKSHKWYTYFEENGINGNVLIKMESDKIKKALELNEGEESLLETLMAKIIPDNDSKSASMNIKGSSVGYVNHGRSSGHVAGDLVVGGSVTKTESPK